MARSKLVLVFAAAACALPGGLGIWNAPAARAQSALLTIEASTIKPWKSGLPRHDLECSGDRFLAGPTYLSSLVSFAFANHDVVETIPSSLRNLTYYVIEAKASGPIQTEEQCRLITRALLADRFKLTFHWEEREATLYDLVVAPSGAKLQQALPTDEGPDISIYLDGRMYGSLLMAQISDPEIRGQKGLTMAQLARHLPLSLKVPPAHITDKTGLEGRYKINLRYSTPDGDYDGDLPVDPPLDIALAKVGLRLVKQKGTIQVPVIDHLEAPDEN